ncbi:helix-turn-helix transcriptional regulator [Mucilaginibacter sp. cycad4]|uniref:helix-turn-helix domain-containing protein n=1 Tax=Mucilaginibacter sp. cycad4 TaxID=3342096 RepID=UPI002AAB9076|nr:helix-turn-helix transcriptional regulator [Mucilaginibacter gossypii]WPV01640.1 helix-turn-helix transcriptional regulator [Mucilaginibacter gossypii]
MNELLRIKTISGFHDYMGLPKPAHPLVSLWRFEDVNRECLAPFSRIMDFFSIAIKRNFNVKMKYGQQPYDFNAGIMFCMAPGQVLRVEMDHHTASRPAGWNLLIHPDFLWHTSLAKTIKKYAYFDYAIHEALFLSAKEEELLISIMQRIDEECRANQDQFSQEVIIAQIELLLKYTDRFYHRQFLTRKMGTHEILARLEQILNVYFTNDHMRLPSVNEIAEQLHISPNYLSGLLKTLTGQSTQQHIHDKLIEKAKEKLSTTNLSISEIAYAFGFEHPQSFSKLFKAKTEISPQDFRQAFN